MSYNEKYMRKAIALSIRNVDNGGGPFAALIVKNGDIVAQGVNRVTQRPDPTAHAEIEAIRKAAKKLGTFDLSGCEIYASCEPCPMCLGAIYWAHLDSLYYGNTQRDAGRIGFDDSFIYDEIKKAPENRKIEMKQYLADEAIIAFEKWGAKKDKTEY